MRFAVLAAALLLASCGPGPDLHDYSADAQARRDDETAYHHCMRQMPPLHKYECEYEK